VVAGVSSDRLYPVAHQAELAAGIAGAGEPRVIDPPYGHDGFLVEAPTVDTLLDALLSS
jgi:homoserine O-acetyltransferase